MAKVTRARRPVEERFWSKVDKSGPCWLWTGATLKDGYGNLKVGGRTVQAHRLSWEMHHGAEPSGQVCHTCDNPSCVRPDHLFVGDQADNMRDMAAKGRTGTRAGDEHWTRQRPDAVVRGAAHPWSSGDHALGEANAKAKLSDAAVRAIRDAKPSYGYATRLAREYGVSPGTVRSIRRGETWSHVASRP